MTGAHDSYLVALSVLIAIFASFTALDLAGRVRASWGWRRRIWLVAATAALGGGIWSMHFVAMQAFSIPGMEMSYDLGLTLLSLAIALLFTGAGFGVLSLRVVSAARIVPAGLLMGLGVLAMHYLGMAAMRMPAAISYQRGWFAVSALIAVGAAIAAIWLAARDKKLSHRLLAACVMGAAIAGMHFAGMRAAVFTSAPGVDLARASASIGQTNLAIVIGAITVAILVMSLGAARVERLFRTAARRQARTTIRLKVADALRERDVGDALREVAALMGNYFGVPRVGYGRLDQANREVDYHICWTDGSVAPLLGRMSDADTGHRIGATNPVGVAAALVVPLDREGTLRRFVYLDDRAPRGWSERDVAFVEEIAERTRLVIARADAEDQLRDLNATLEQRVAAEVGARMATEEALRQSQKVEAIGQLTGGVAHDFNNLLTVIRGSTELLRRADLSDDRRARYVEAIADASDRAAKLTGQLLAFARRQTLTPEMFDVAANIAAIREMIGSLLGSRVRFEVTAPDEPLFVDADAIQFDTAIVNMAANARDAMAGAGVIAVVVGMARQLPGLRSHEPRDGDFVTVAITDSGSGIEAHDLLRIFEPFYTTKAVGEGTGLGLSQVFGFAKQSGGDVAVVSEVGQGTTFTLYLPRATARPAIDVDARPDAPLADAATGCVLVVEDNAPVGLFATATLGELGYTTVFAANAEAALAELATDADRFDVVFSDVIMPGMTGLDLARLVRRDHPDLPVVLTSGYSEVLAQEGSAGFDLLHKPYTVEQLARAMRKATAERRRSVSGSVRQGQ